MRNDGLLAVWFLSLFLGGLVQLNAMKIEECDIERESVEKTENLGGLSGDYMRVNIDQLKEKEEIEIEFSENFIIPQEYDVENNLVHISSVGKVKNMGDYYSFTCKCISSNVVFSCALCLESVEKNFEFTIHDKFSRYFDSLGDEDVWKFDGKEINLSESVLSFLIMNIPPKVVCDNNCKGLCQQCGVNLNENLCSCGKDKIDERFSLLNDLFKDRE